MEISPQTTTHVYLKERECLHVIATSTQLRVRWMRDGVWFLRWDALIGEGGVYTDTRLDGKLVESASMDAMEHERCDVLLQCMQDASERLPLYPNPDIVQELQWFALDESFAQPPSKMV